MSPIFPIVLVNIDVTPEKPNACLSAGCAASTATKSASTPASSAGPLRARRAPPRDVERHAVVDVDDGDRDARGRRGGRARGARRNGVSERRSRELRRRDRRTVGARLAAAGRAAGAGVVTFYF